MMQHIAPEIIERVNRFFGYAAVARVHDPPGRRASAARRAARRPSLKPVPVELGDSLRDDRRSRTEGGARGAGRRASPRRAARRSSARLRNDAICVALRLLRCCSPLPPAGASRRAPPRRAADWIATVARDARRRLCASAIPTRAVKLVEYGSLHLPALRACSQAEGVPRAARANMSRSGTVSYRIARLPMRDALDLAAALLARCVAPTGFFAAARRDAWPRSSRLAAPRRSTISQANAGAARALSEPARSSAPIADALGLDRARRGARHDRRRDRAPASPTRPRSTRDRQALTRPTTPVRRSSGTPDLLRQRQARAAGHDWAALEPDPARRRRQMIHDIRTGDVST